MRANDTATINLVINGDAAKTSLREISGALNGVRSALSGMNEQENPERYRALIAQERALALAQQSRRREIISTTQSLQEQNHEQKGFFADFKKGFSEIQEMAGKITAGTLIYKGISSAIEAVSNLIQGSKEQYEEAQRTQTALENKLTQTGGAAGITMEKLQALQEVQMKLTGVDDDVIAKGEDVVLSYEKITGAIYEKTIPAALNLAAAQNKGIVTMDGMTSASELLSKILEKPTEAKKKLLKIGIDLSDEMKREIDDLVEHNRLQEAQAIILDQVDKRYGNLAKTLADTDVGKIQQFETRLGNIQESIGKFEVSLKAAQYEALEPFVRLLEKATTTRLSDTLEEDRVSLMSATLELQQSNLSHDKRIKLINSLKDQYPEYLSDLNAEKVSNKDLLPILNQINEAMVLRIAYQKKSEDLKNALEDEADAMLKADHASQNFAKTMANIMAKFKDKGIDIIMPKNLTDMQQADFLLRQIQAHKADGTGLNDNLMTHDLQIAKQQVLELKEGFKEASGARQKFVDEQKRFADQYGFNSDGKDKKQQQYDADHPLKKPQTGPTSEQKAAAETLKKQQADYLASSAALNAQLKEFRAGQLADTLSKNDKEVAALENKFDKEITVSTASLKKLKDSKFANAEEIASQQKQIDDLAVQKVAAVEALKLKQQQEGEKLRKEQDEKDKEARFKAASEKIDDVFNNSAADLNNQQQTDLNAITGEPDSVEAQRYNIQQIYAEKSFQLEQEHLGSMKELYALYGKDTGALDKKIGDNAIKEADRTAKAQIKEAQDLKIAKKQLQELEIGALESGAKLVQQIAGKNTIAYKAAFAVEQGIAAARVVLNTESAIIAYAASVAALGPAGVGLAASYTIIARISEGIALAAIAAQTVTGLKGDSTSTDKKAKGGMIPQGPSHADGGINLINNKTGEHIAEMEGGEPIFIFSKDTYRNNAGLINQLLFNSMYNNGASVDVPGVTQGIRQARNGGVFNDRANATDLGDASAPISQPVYQGMDLNETNRLLAALHDKFDELSKRPIDFNIRAMQEYTDKLDKIKSKATA